MLRRATKLRAAHVQRLARSCSQTANKHPADHLGKFQDNEQVECVIIGGGVLGGSMLYHLTKAGINDTILLEKGVLTCGSTWHAAGLVALYNGGTNLRIWHERGVELLKVLEEETGQSTSFHTPGSIRLIDDIPDRIDEAKFQMGKSKFYTNPQRLIGLEEIKELHPFVETAGLWGGIYNDGDGHADPTSVTNSFIKGGKNRGGRVIERCPVIGLEQTADRKWRVQTEQGTIIANKVINCGGLWGQQVARMAGVHMPACIIQHQYVITDDIPEIEEFKKKSGQQIPVLRSLSGSYYLRQERNGILVGPYECSSAMQLQDEWNFAPEKTDGTPISFENDLFQEDLDRLGEHLEHASELMPLFGTAGIRAVVNGPVSWPPDGNGIVGPVEDQGVFNFYQACGFSYGIAQSAGAGDYLTNWIVNGEPPYELFETDPTRYGPWATKYFTSAKVRETYGMNNMCVYPKEERMAGRPLRCTPVYDRMKAKGAQFGFHNGLEQPLWFCDDAAYEPHYQPSFRKTNWHDAVGKEVKKTCEGMGIMDMSSFSKFIISGPNSRRFLEKVSANKIPTIGKVAICHMLMHSGKMLAELTVTCINEDEFYIVTGSDLERHDLRWWVQNMDPEGGVDIKSVTKDWTVLAIAGPNAEAVLQKLTPELVNKENYKFFTHKKLEIGSEDYGSSVAHALRLSFTGLEGFEFHVPCDEMNVLYDNLWREAEALGPVTDFGAYGLDSFRLEAGFKFLNPDMTKDYEAFDAGIQKFVKMKNRDFIGKDACKKQKKDGPASGRRCVKIQVDTTEDSQDPRPIAYAYGDNAIYAKTGEGDDESMGMIGWTTSGGFSHQSQRNLCIAHINIPSCVEGKEIQVEVLGALKTGKVLGFV